MARWKESLDDSHRLAVQSFFEPTEFLRTLRNWILFYFEYEEMRKSVLRQHQRRAVEQITRRCSEPNKQRGLIWHAQGSGKTFTAHVRTSDFGAQGGVPHAQNRLLRCNGNVTDAGSQGPIPALNPLMVGCGSKRSRVKLSITPMEKNREHARQAQKHNHHHLLPPRQRWSGSYGAWRRMRIGP